MRMEVNFIERTMEMLRSSEQIEFSDYIQFCFLY